jgi:phosphoserine phosphatase RsbU/P
MNGKSPQPIKFLLVDDLAENLVALEALLRRDELELFCARSGREALELLLVHDFALAFIDVQMPEMDGFELAELMRGMERTRHVPIIFVTADAHERQRVFQGYDAGAVDFLFKPIDPRILRHKADTFFRLNRQKQLLDEQLELLRESEEFRRRMIESSQDCIAVLDQEGRVLTLNLSFANRLADPDTARMRGKDWASIWSESERGTAQDAVLRARGGAEARFIGRTAAAQLADAWWDVAITPIHDAGGRVDKLLAVARDVTEHRKALEERERLAGELLETLRLNETFVAAITHDLRNPLSAMLTMADLLARRSSDPATQRSAERIRASGRRMATMIDALFDLARARLGGGLPIQPVPTDLSPLSRKVLAEHQATHPDQVIEIQEMGDLEGYWDGDRIEQLVSNLLGNALRHGKRPGIVRLEVDGRAEGEVSISVHNAGHIDPVVMPHLFDAFRGGARSAARSEGLGLGLYIVQQIVKGHGGAVHVDSSDEAGTTFRVHLPRGQAGMTRVGDVTPSPTPGDVIPWERAEP